MPHIFVSYARKDMDFAGKIVQALAEKNLDTWIDWKSIPKGEYWEQEIYGGIEEADAFLFLISPDSVRSQMCNKEIAHAVENSKRILPIVIRDAEMANFEAELPRQEISKRNWIFCREGQDHFIAAIGEMLNTIHTDYEWLKYHTRLQVQALEWERSGYEKSFLLHGKELQNAELQLATNSSKEPYPTDLQRECVLKSRQASDRQRRITTGIAFAGVIAMAVLAAFGFIQSKLAQDRANIALARQLAAQAQSIFATGFFGQSTAVLLAVRSMQLFPLVDAAQIIQNTTLAYPIARMTHAFGVTSVAFSPDGKYIASGSDDSTIHVWEVSTRKEIARMTYGLGRGVTSVAFSPDGKYIASGIDIGTPVLVWEVETRKEIARMTHAFGVTSVAFSPDGKYVVSGGWDKTIRVWEVATGKELAQMTHAASVHSVAFSPDGKYVVSGSKDNTARVWEVQTGKEIARMTHDDVITSVAFSPDGKYAVTGSEDKTTRVWEVQTVEMVHMTDAGSVTSVAFSPDGKLMASEIQQNIALVWEVETGEEIARMTHDDVITSVAFSPDGKYVVTGSEDNTACVWEMTSNKKIACIAHDSNVTSVAFSPDGKYVVSGGWDKTIRVWEVATGKELAQMTHDNGVTSVAFSPDGKYIASGSWDDTARVWEAQTGKEIARMTHAGDVTSVAFSPDGKYVVSGNEDNTARVWEVQTGKEIARMTHASSVTLVVFSLDEEHVVSDSKDNILRVWIYRPEDLITDACSRLNRNLTRAEWQQYIGDALPYQAVCPNLPIEPEATATP